MSRSPLYQHARVLAELFVQYLPGYDTDELVKLASKKLFNNKKPRWLRVVCRTVDLNFTECRCRPLISDVTAVIARIEPFKNAYIKGNLNYPSYAWGSKRMLPALGRPEHWQLPAATTTRELAKLVELHIDDLFWLLSPNPKHEHYHLRWHSKSGGGKRLIEAPKPLLKETQRIILNKILNQIQPHEAACGFRQGSSIFNFVEPHCDQSMVLKMDFRNYFPSIRSGRVRRLFMTAGYPETLAGYLSDLCCHKVPDSILNDQKIGSQEHRLYTRPHLPQGSPTSPSIANLVTYRLDCRLAGLARSVGVNYTRYADDLLFSGDVNFSKQAESFHLKVLSIVIEEGFSIHPRKTRFMRRSQKQHAAGLILNDKPNLDRRAFDRLKATLTNCLRNGADAENRLNHPEFAAHLRGKILWLEQSNPNRAEKLWKIFHQINFPTRSA